MMHSFLLDVARTEKGGSQSFKKHYLIISGAVKSQKTMHFSVEGVMDL